MLYGLRSRNESEEEKKSELALREEKEEARMKRYLPGCSWDTTMWETHPSSPLLLTKKKKTRDQLLFRVFFFFFFSLLYFYWLLLLMLWLTSFYLASDQE